MFTGIIEHLGTVESLHLGAEGGRVTIHAPKLAPSLAVSQSVAVNGCCLTVVSLTKKSFSADLSGETVRKTSFGAEPHVLKPGGLVNLEQPLTAGKEFGGHFVLGHVDTIGHVTEMTREGESWRLGVEIPEDFARYVVPQGSITIDGISLTVARWENRSAPRIAEAAIIPYTYSHTNLCERNPGDAVNLEGDVLGKYIEQNLAARTTANESLQIAPQSKPKLTIATLINQGW